MPTLSLGTIILLYSGGLLLLVAEAFFPGAIMGLIGTCMVCVSVYFGYTTQGTVFAAVQVVLAGIVVPIAFRAGFRRLSLRKTLAEGEGFRAGSEALDSLVGVVGLTLTPLRPAGTALFGTRRIDVISAGEPIDKDTAVRVMEVAGMRVVVRSVTDEAPQAPSA